MCHKLFELDRCRQRLLRTCACTAPPDALLRHTGRVRCTPDPCVESSANSQGHRTRATVRTLSVRCSPDSCAKRVAKMPAHRTLSTGLTPVRPMHSAHLRHRLTPHRTLWTSVRCCQHQCPVSLAQASPSHAVSRRQVLLKLHRHTRSLASKPPTCPSLLQPVHRAKPHLDLLHLGHMTQCHVSYAMSTSIIT